MNNAHSLTLALGGHWHGSYGLAFCPAHENTHTPALSLGDGIDGQLLAHCFAGCTFAEIIAAMRRRGLSGGNFEYQPITKARPALKRQHTDASERRSKQASQIWAMSQPISGTLAETYLRGRGIDCSLPDTLRYAPHCWHATAQHMPVLVACVEGGEGFAVHRTYLRADGRGKALARPDKAMLGPCQGGAVRLSQCDGPLIVAEGLETALSFLCGLHHGPATVWAALSASGMTSLHLPQKAGRLKIAADGDKAGCEAAHALATRADALGWKVSILPAPQGHDWNDVLCMKGGAA